MDALDPLDSVELCISKCPNRKLYTPAAVKELAQNEGILLCDYNLNISDYESANYGRKGPCPDLPVWPTYVLCCLIMFPS